MVEWDGLENRCARKGTVSSNLTSSAILQNLVEEREFQTSPLKKIVIKMLILNLQI